VFARKLSLSFGKSRTVSNFVAQQEKNCSDGSGYLSFGPFFLGGGAADFNNGTSKRDWGYRYDGNAMSVDGMQLIGFRCHGMPKCPDPDPAIPDNAWV
jgi:hypothetical protein